VILGSDLVVAANRCKAAGANVINMSLGGGGFSLAESTAFADLFTNDNILSIAAAGNDGDTPEGTELSYPASYGSVVSVAALDSNKTVASFSQRNNQVDIAAPGVAVLSTISMGKGVSGGTLDVSGVSYNGLPMTGSATGSVSGFLVDCGLGVDDCTAASGQICLISRGEILFSDKVLACQNGGGLGAVIYNNAAGDLFGVLGGVDTQIPSIGISDIAGEFLMANFLARRARFEVGVSNYAPFDGTSMACPHVAAVAALIWSHDPTKTAGEVRAALESTAEDLGIPGKDNEYGYGLVQAVAACSALTGSSCTSEASAGPSSEPTAGPSSKPSSAPTAGPSSGPSSEPTAGPSAGPSQGPSSGPTLSSSPPSGSPSEESSLAPTLSSSPPSGSPSEESSLAPSVSSSSPSAASLEPSAVPREVSSLEQPTVAPSRRASMGSSSSSASPPNLHFYSWIAAPSLLVLALFFAA
jgi:serine protease